jgi:hypothetical protein
LAGVTAIDVGPCTVIVVVPETPEKTALMVVEPIETEVAIPEALIVATPESEDPQVTSDVTSLVVLFDSVPVAENCWVVPTAMTGFMGVIAIEVTVAAVSVVVPETPVKFAVMTVEPAATAVVIPLELIVAIPVFDELQATRLVKSWETLFDKIPVAVNC